MLFIKTSKAPLREGKQDQYADLEHFLQTSFRRLNRIKITLLNSLQVSCCAEVLRQFTECSTSKLPSIPVGSKDSQKKISVTKIYLVPNICLYICPYVSVHPSLLPSIYMYVYPFVPTSLCPYVCTSVPTFVRLYVSLYILHLSIPAYIRLYFHPSVLTSIRPYICLPLCPSLLSSVHRSVPTSVRPYLRRYVHPSVPTSVCPYVRPSFCTHVCTSISTSICSKSVCPSQCTYTCPSLCPSAPTSVPPSPHPSLLPSVCTYVGTSLRSSVPTCVRLSIRLSIHPYVCPYVCPYFHPSVSCICLSLCLKLLFLKEPQLSDVNMECCSFSVEYTFNFKYPYTNIYTKKNTHMKTSDTHLVPFKNNSQHILSCINKYSQVYYSFLCVLYMYLFINYHTSLFVLKLLHVKEEVRSKLNWLNFQRMFNGHTFCM